MANRGPRGGCFNCGGPHRAAECSNSRGGRGGNRGRAPSRRSESPAARGGGGIHGRASSKRGGTFAGRGAFNNSQPAGVFGDGEFPMPDTNIEKLEDDSVGDLASKFAGTALQEQLPCRPGYGTQGRKIILWANYFELQPAEGNDLTLYRYNITFQTDNEMPKSKKKRYIQSLLQMTPFAGIDCASDWAQLLIATKRIGLQGKRQSYNIELYPNEGEPWGAGESVEQTKARKNATVTVLVEEKDTVSLGELMRDLASGSTVYPLKSETIQALNILLAQGPSTDTRVATVSGNKFYPLQGHAQYVHAVLGEGLIALRGYFSSVRTSVNRILVNVNVTSGAFYTSCSLLELLKEIGYPSRHADKHRQIVNFVKKLRVETTYLPKLGTNGKPIQAQFIRQIRTINNLSPSHINPQNASFKWETRDGQDKDVTIEQYFQQAYGIKLACPTDTMVNYSTDWKKPRWIPAELCTVLPGQLARRQLKPNQTREMIGFAARQPAENAKSIVNDGLQVTKIKPLASNMNTHLIKFGIKVSPNMLTVNGRVLGSPTLRYKDTRSHRPADGTWNLVDRGRKISFADPKPLSRWGCLVIDKDNRQTIPGGADVTQQLLESFSNSLQDYGLQVGPRTDTAYLALDWELVKDRNIDAIYDALFAQIKSMTSIEFLFVLLPDDNAMVYDCIKYICDVQLGLHNVCSIGYKFSNKRGQPQYFANVALKFNQKLGGTNYFIATDELEPLDARTIVFGIDVTHPSPGSSEGSPSIAGVVASCDSKFSQYPASIRTQKGKVEMVAGLEEMVIERMNAWSQRNDGYPNKVIVYRDGVSESQYKSVMKEEYPAFVGAFNKLYGAVSKHPKISIIVVGKRHHTRFYPTTTEDADQRTGNAPPGTVVDRGVTGEKLFDFFLLAHKGLQGTSRPAHYVVLKDDNKLGADQLQILTHNLCYTFARATRAVSMCPPAYYADLLCERGRAYLHGVLKGEGMQEFNHESWQHGVHQAVADSMFYL